MKGILKGLGFATLLALVFNVAPAHAQTAVSATTSATPLRYDVSKEITLNATVQSVPSKSSVGYCSLARLALCCKQAPARYRGG